LFEAQAIKFAFRGLRPPSAKLVTFTKNARQSRLRLPDLEVVITDFMSDRYAWGTRKTIPGRPEYLIWRADPEKDIHSMEFNTAEFSEFLLAEVFELSTMVVLGFEREVWVLSLVGSCLWKELKGRLAALRKVLLSQAVRNDPKSV